MIEVAKNLHNKIVLLFVHFGDAQFRGSERCLLNILKGIDRSIYRVALWSNHKKLNDSALFITDDIVFDTFSPPFGFGYPASANGKFADYFDLIKKTNQVVRDIAPNLIVCNSIAPCQWIAPVSLRCGIPLISYNHTNYLPKSRLLSFACAVSHMVGVSKFTLENFIQDGFPIQNTSVIYNGVDDLSLQGCTRSSLRMELDIGQDEFVITCICALVDWKKVDLLIESFRILPQNPERKSTLLIVGDGPCMAALQIQAKGLEIIFCGWREDIANILAASDCVAVAAEREAFCLSLIEAASMSLPLIGVKAGGVQEIIVEGSNGIYAEVGSPASMAKAFKKLRDDSRLRSRLGRQARQDYEKLYRVERMTTEMYSLFDRLAGRNKTHKNSSLIRVLRLLKISLWLISSRLLKIHH